MMKAAKLCARSGEHESAVRLLLNAQVDARKRRRRRRVRPPQVRPQSGRAHPLADDEPDESLRRLAEGALRAGDQADRGRRSPREGPRPAVARHPPAPHEEDDLVLSEVREVLGGEVPRARRRRRAPKITSSASCSPARRCSHRSTRTSTCGAGRRRGVNDEDEEGDGDLPAAVLEGRQESKSPWRKRCASTTAAAAPCSARRRRTAMSRSSASSLEIEDEPVRRRRAGDDGDAPRRTERPQRMLR